MTTPTESGISTAELEVSTIAHPPASGAEDQKPTAPAPDADVQNPEAAAETPEQAEAKKESRRARSNARKAAALAEARTEARLLRERLDKLEAQPKANQETGEPKRDDFPDYEAYLRAVTKYDAAQVADGRLKADREAQAGKEKQQQAQQGSEKIAKAWTERETAFQVATKDYETVVQPFADDELQTLAPQARMAIVESEMGPALLYHLAKNPEEAERIAELPPLRQVAELGKLEAKVSMPAKKTTSAPAPASTTSGGRTATKDLEKMNQTEYEAHRKGQGARWAR